MSLEEASKVVEEYKRILDYKKQMGFLTQWAENERFRAGKQWPPPTEKTRNLPRPVFNIIKRIESFKVASVMNENVKMVYSVSEATEDEFLTQAAERFTQSADWTWEDIKQDQLNEKALRNGSNTGTAIWHYYYDTTEKGGMSLKWLGKMRGEVINVMNFFPGNPQNDNVQKQPFIIITHRDLVTNVRKEAEANKVPKDQIAMIVPDKDTEDQGYDMALHEVSNADKVTVITKYWKENGQVYFMKVASNVIVKPKTNTNLKLYPIVVMQWEEREQSIFGTSDTESLIPNQKIINFLIAMQVLSVQLTGWPKIRVNPAYVKQQVTNTPGEVIQDIAPRGEYGVEYMNPAVLPNSAPKLVESILSWTKEVTGANESALGEKISSDLNASAIMLLQKQAGVPIESLKRRFYQAMEDVGRVWEDMWKVYYLTKRLIPAKDENGNDISVPFRGADYQDVELHLKIDIGPSSSYSETLMMSSLDKLFDNKYISLQQYLKYAPKNVIPFKDRLLKEIEEQQQQAQQDQMQQMMSRLTPEEQQAFSSAPPEIQQQVMQQAMQNTQPNMQQPQQSGLTGLA